MRTDPSTHTDIRTDLAIEIKHVKKTKIAGSYCLFSTKHPQRGT
jgi:hypothetical protein